MVGMEKNPFILQMKGITKKFPGVKALDNVTLEVRRGSIHAICGENGAGKSTLMKVLSGVYPYGTYDGQIFFMGKEMKFKNIKESENAGIAIIHQEHCIDTHLYLQHEKGGLRQSVHNAGIHGLAGARASHLHGK